MSKETEISDLIKPDGSEGEVIKEEINLQFHWYLILFFTVYYTSWILPGFIILGYFIQYFIPNFLDISNFVDIFLNLNSLLALLSMPLLIIGAYLVRLTMLGIITRILWRISERISPSKNGIIPRNVRSRAANYYHLRSFMLKYGKNTFTKGMFPWLSRWFFNFVGSSKIGKGTTIEESVGSDKFVDVGKNCYIGVNNTLASHLVQGIFGNIQYFEIKVGDNVTMAAMNNIGPGSEIKDDSYLLPYASISPFSSVKGEGNYYYGIPMRKIFKKKIMSYLGLTEEDLDKNKNISLYIEKLKEKKKEKDKSGKKIQSDKNNSKEEVSSQIEEKRAVNELSDEDLALDFTTSSAISRVNIKFLAVYLPIFWLSGLMVAIFWYEYTKEGNWLGAVLYLPIAIITMLYIFILGVLLFSKLLLIFINLLHKPKEGIFIAEIRDRDYEFWMLRTELKKIALWLLRNSPLPWIDALAFKWFGVKMDFSSHMNDAWCDGEFMSFGRKVLVGQGATLMCSMVVGKYLIIKRVIFDDYVMVGGHTTIAPGTIIGHDSVIGALSTTTYNQILDDSWIYLGIPAIKLKKNKYAEERRDIIIRRQVDEGTKSEDIHEVNIDEDKKKLIKTGEEE